jgi:hypothetical protein
MLVATGKEPHSTLPGKDVECPGSSLRSDETSYAGKAADAKMSSVDEAHMAPQIDHDSARLRATRAPIAIGLAGQSSQACIVGNCSMQAVEWKYWRRSGHGAK